MLKIFRQAKVVQCAPAQPADTPTRSPFLFFRGDAPLPEVSEGNTEADWALWEDSAAALEQRVSGHEDPAGATLTQAGESTPATVHKKG